MGRLLQDAETSAGRKRIALLIYQEDGKTPWAGSVTSKKAAISINGAAEAASTNDIVRVGGALHYLELTNTEAASATAGDQIYVRVAASGGNHLEAINYFDVLGGDWFSAPVTATQVADATLGRDMSLVSGAAARSPLNALRSMRNRVGISGGTMTVYQEDDSTSAWTGVVTGTPSVTQIDPA
jgi:hypothetical protein